MPAGYSSLAGQVINAHDPEFSPSGSSAGSAVAASMAFSGVTMGTETSGSILSPSDANGVVGVKTTLGLVSRFGILPLAPDEPSVLSNLGLSYALSKDLVRAETTLRRAADQPHVDPRVRKNLALVVGLQGRWSEADGIAASGLPPDEGTPHVAHLRQMLALQDGWKQSEVAVKPLIRAEGS
jgi:hypothetical protein